MKSGPRNRRVIFQRQTTTTDNYGAAIATWATYTTVWAQVLFGTGAERREAAQESASAPATFRILYNPTTTALTAQDRISFLSSIWDITSIVPLGFNEGYEITAIRRLT